MGMALRTDSNFLKRESIPTDSNEDDVAKLELKSKSRCPKEHMLKLKPTRESSYFSLV